MAAPDLARRAPAAVERPSRGDEPRRTSSARPRGRREDPPAHAGVRRKPPRCVMRAQHLVRATLLALAAMLALASAASGANFTMAVIGDTPYGDTRIQGFPND